MKCIVCSGSFELSAADNKKRFMHDPAYCSIGCFIQHNDRKPTDSDMWNIHVGPVQKLPKNHSIRLSIDHCPSSRKFKRSSRY